MKILWGFCGAILFTTMSTVWAAAGTLDTSFANGGWLHQPGFSTGATFGRAVLTQPDGKYIVVGTTTGFGQSDNFFATRFNANGGIDTSFGSNGIADIDFLSGADVIGDGVRQSDGKIVLVGQCDDRAGNRYFCAARLTNAGVLDATFGSSGKVILSAAASADFPAATIDSAGRIVAVGQDSISYDAIRGAIRRLNANGSPDTSFGIDGTMLYPTDVSYLYAVTTDVDNNIYTVGTGANTPQVLNKLLSDGRVDTRFGINGTATDSDTDLRLAQAIALQADGNILVGTYRKTSDPSTQYDAAVIRYLADGSRDTSFGVNGISTFDEDYREDVRELGVLSDGSIIVGATTRNSTYTQIRLLIAKLSSSGSLLYKHAQQTIDSKADYLRGMQVLNDGSVIANSNSNHVGSYHTVQLKLNPAGVPDLTFANSGQNHFSPKLAKPINWIRSIKLANGKQLYLGQVDESTAVIVRLLTTGELDPDFSTEGSFVFSNYASFETLNSDPMVQLELTASGKLVLARRAVNYGGYITSIVVLDSDGRLDSTFGDAGELAISDAPSLQSIERIAVRSDGKMLLIGRSHDYPSVMTIHQLKADGSTDTAFGTNGSLTYHGAQPTRAVAAQLDAQNRLIVVANEGNSAFVSRVTLGGAWDTEFGVTNGLTLLSKDNRFTAKSLQIQSDDRLFITGETESTRVDAALFVLHNNGGFDTAFGQLGYQHFSFASGSSRGDNVFPVSGNRFMITGTLTSSNTDDDFFLARLSATGTIDNTFGNNGVVTFGTVGSNDRVAHSLNIGQGKILLSGSCQGLACGAMIVVESPAIELSAITHNFGQINVNAVSAPLVINISNTGLASLDISSIAVAAPFQQSNTCPASLAPLSQCEVRVAFAPNAAGNAAVMLTINTNAGDRQISLSGTGVAVTPPPTDSGSSGGGGSLGSVLSMLMLSLVISRRKLRAK